MKDELKMDIVEVRIRNIYNNATSDDRGAVSRFITDCFPESVVPSDWSDLPNHIVVVEDENDHGEQLAEWAIASMVSVYGPEGLSQVVIVWFQDSLATLEERFKFIGSHVNKIRPNMGSEQ